MRARRIVVAFVASLASGTLAAQSILFFENSDFNGRRFGSDYSVSNLADAGFNDRAVSLVIRNGSWQICTDAYFRGRCVTLGPGEYRNLSQIGMSYQISSARQLGIVPPGEGGGGGQHAALTVYEGEYFSGSSLGVNRSIENLGNNSFNDRIRSIVVENGTWELCRDGGFQGGCETFAPGRYANIGFLTGKVSSIRPVAGGGRPPDWGGGGRVLLYEHAGFGGRSFAINQDMIQNLAGLGFNDRAASMRVERGYWMFCSDADFQGTCRTFGPGDYPTLEWGLDHKISSGRRIHGEYPYNHNPNWNGYSQQ